MVYAVFAALSGLYDAEEARVCKDCVVDRKTKGQFLGARQAQSYFQCSISMRE